MKISLKISQATEANAFDIAELIYSTSLKCCFSSEQLCPEWYKESVRPSHIAELLKSEQMVWLVATERQTLVGVLTVSEMRYIKYFFVRPAYQKLGVGRQLWDFALHSGVLGSCLTVRSSIFAAPVYERLGFIAVDAPLVVNGIHFQTMVANYG